MAPHLLPRNLQNSGPQKPDFWYWPTLWLYKVVLGSHINPPRWYLGDASILTGAGHPPNFSPNEVEFWNWNLWFSLSQSSNYIKKHNLNENVRADTAGSAKYVSDENDKTKAAIASELSADIYNLKLLKKDIQNEKNNVTRFLLMGKEIYQPELKNENYITSFLFKLKSKPAALYSALSGFAINGVNMTKLQSFPEKNSFSSFFFLCDIEGHIEDKKIKNSLEELGLHCEDMHVLGVFNSDKFRQK